jgi:Calx-beta domain/Domain of unknown function (DUF4214)
VAFSWFGSRRKMKSGARRSSSVDLAKSLSFKPQMEALEDRLTPTAGVSVLQFKIVPPSGAPAFTFGGTDLVTTMPITGAGTVTVEVDRTTDPGDTVALNTTVSAQFSTSDETAIAGTNYTETSGTVTIPAGQTSATFTVPILHVAPLQSGALQGNKVFAVSLSSPSAEATINPVANSTAVTIKDSGGTLNQRYVNAVFQELLDRPADLGALQFFGGELDGGTAEGVVLLQIETAVNSSGRIEYNDNTVNNLFQEFLGRNADLGALNFFGSQLTSGVPLSTVTNANPAAPPGSPTISLPGATQLVEAEIIGSDEYFTNAGGTNTGFVNAVYRDLVNRNPDAGGLAFYLGVIDQASQLNPTEPQSVIRAAMANNFLVQAETINDELTNFYAIYLNRNPDPTGLAFYTGQLNGTGNGGVPAPYTGFPTPLQTVINEYLGNGTEYIDQFAIT